MIHFKLLFVLICCFCSFLIFPAFETVTPNRIVIDIQLSTPEKETYVIQGDAPFDFIIQNPKEFFQISIPHTTDIEISDELKKANKTALNYSNNLSQQAVIQFSLTDFPYFSSHYFFQFKTLVVELSKHSPKSLFNKLIVIDPGHGAYSDEKDLWDYYDCGVIGSSGIFESVINLSIAELVKKGLEKNGAEVVLTRESEKDRNNLRFDQRGKLVNDLLPDVFVSIHQNGSIDPNIRGTVVYYSNPIAQKLAQNIAKEITHKTSIPFRYLFPGKFELIESMKIQAKVLVECAFLSNRSDEQILISSQNQQNIADAIVMGIINFFEN